MDQNSFAMVTILGLFLTFLVVLILVQDSHDTLLDVERSVIESNFECLRTQLRELRAELDLVRISVEDLVEEEGNES